MAVKIPNLVRFLFRSFTGHCPKFLANNPKKRLFLVTMTKEKQKWKKFLFLNTFPKIVPLLSRK